MAARWARRAHIPVLADLDTVYKKVEKLFPYLDYLIASTQFLPAVTGHADPFKVLENMAREYHVGTPGMTLGRDGALVYHAGRFFYSPGFVVETVDTTGAGDVFHGAFAYALLAGWDIARALGLLERHGRAQLHRARGAGWNQVPGRGGAPDGHGPAACEPCIREGITLRTAAGP